MVLKHSWLYKYEIDYMDTLKSDIALYVWIGNMLNAK